MAGTVYDSGSLSPENKISIQKGHRRLCKCIRISPKIWKLLFNKEVFSLDERKSIEGRTDDMEEQVSELLFILGKKPDIYFQNFLKCLDDSGQHEAYLILKDGVSKHIKMNRTTRLSSYLRLTLDFHDKELKEELLMGDRFLKILFQRRVIDEDRYAAIKRTSSDSHANWLIDHLKACTDSKYYIFIKALRLTDQLGLVEKIEETAGKERLFEDTLREMLEHIRLNKSMITIPDHENVLREVKLDRIFTNVTLRSVKTGHVCSWEEIFKKFALPGVNRISLDGMMGVGKTTWIHALLINWGRRVKGLYTSSAYSELDIYRYVICIDIQKIESNSNLKHILSTQLGICPENSDALVVYLKSNPTDVVIILDSFESYRLGFCPDMDELIGFKHGSNLKILFVGQLFGSTPSERNDHTFELIGLYQDEMQRCVSKYMNLFSEYGMSSQMENDLFSQRSLFELYEVPFFLLHVSSLWQKGRSLPFNKSILWHKLLKQIFQYLRNIPEYQDENDFVIDVDMSGKLSLYCLLQEKCNELLRGCLHGSQIKFIGGIIRINKSGTPIHRFISRALHIFLAGLHLLNGQSDSISLTLENLSLANAKEILKVTHMIAESLTECNSPSIREIIIKWTKGSKFQQRIQSLISLKQPLPGFNWEAGDPYLRQMALKIMKFKDKDISAVENNTDRKCELIASLVLSVNLNDELPVNKITVTGLDLPRCNLYLDCASLIVQIKTVCISDIIPAVPNTQLAYTSMFKLQYLEYLILEQCHFHDKSYLSVLINRCLTSTPLTKFACLKHKFSGKEFDQVVDAISRSTCLRDIRICFCEGVLSKQKLHLLKTLGNITGLQSIDFSGTFLESTSLAGFSLLLGTLRNLECLVLSDCGLCYCKELQSIFQKLIKTNRIHTLDLSYNDLGDEGTNELAEILPSLSNLHILRIHFSIPNNQIAFSTLLYSLCQVSTLHELEISVSNTGDRFTLELFTDALQDMSDLEVLRVHGKPAITSKLLNHIALGIIKNVQLKELHLHKVTLTEQGWSMLQDSLADSADIKVLSISECSRYSFQSSFHFANGISRKISWEKIILPGVLFGEEGVLGICKEVKNWNKLKALDLSDWNCRNSVLMAQLIALFRFTPKLKLINLSGNMLAADALKEFAAVIHKLPDIRVMRLERCTKGENSGFIELLRSLPVLSKLENLYIGQNLAGDKSISVLSLAIFRLEQLKELDVSENCCKQVETLDDLTQNLRMCAYIESLYIGGNVVSSACLKTLGNVVTLKVLSLRGCICQDNVAVDFLCKGKFTKYLEHFDLAGIERGTFENVISMLVDCRRLCEINLNGWYCNDITEIERLMDVLEYCPLLKGILLDDNGFGDEGFRVLAKKVQCFEHLKKLSIQMWICQDANVYTDLLDKLSSFKNFEMLKLSGNKACESALIILQTAVKRWDELEALTLSGCTFDDKHTLKSLVKELCHCNLLKELDLGYNILAKEVVADLSTLLKHLYQLQILVLRQCTCEDSDTIGNLVANLSDLYTLRKLDLGGNTGGNTALDALCKVVQGLLNLEYVSIASWESDNPKLLQSFLSLIQVCRWLTFLDITGNKIVEFHKPVIEQIQLRGVNLEHSNIKPKRKNRLSRLFKAFS